MIYSLFKQINQVPEEEEAEEEEMGVAETYAEYWPAKCMISPHLSSMLFKIL